MEIRFQSPLASHERVQLSTLPGPGASGGLVLHVRKPSLSERAERTLLNVLTLGLYGRFVERPRQWAALKASLLLEAQGHLSEAQVQQLLDTYSRQGHLTAGRLAVVMDDFERACASAPPWVPLAAAHAPMDASQTVPARARRSLGQRLRRLSAEERALREQARQTIAAAREAPAAPNTAQGAKQQRRVFGADSMLSVLRPGRTIKANAINLALGCLKPLAQTQGQHYGCARAGAAQWDMETQRQQAVEQMLEQGMGPGTEQGLFTMPLGFGGTVLHPENHVVNLTVDFAHRKLLYLDSKALPMEQAETFYANGRGLGEMLSRLGRQLWGEDWQLATGLVQLNLPKQQGANDCGAFTHHFTRCLLQGESVGDIERTFSVQDRAHLRLQMARDIRDATLA